MSESPSATPCVGTQPGFGGPGFHSLSTGEVHLWLVDRSQACRPIDLSAEEHERARRFATWDLRRQYEAGQQHLRTLLAGYAGQAPSELVLLRKPGGKPYLACESVQFSWSHCGAHGVLACSLHGVGVDIERVSAPPPDVMHIACHPLERWALGRATDPSRGFASLWTAKEACLKADGRGLSVNPSTLCALDATGSPADKVRVPGGSSWRVRHVAAGPAHVAAVATPDWLGALSLRVIAYPVEESPQHTRQ